MAAVAVPPPGTVRCARALTGARSRVRASACAPPAPPRRAAAAWPPLRRHGAPCGSALAPPRAGFSFSQSVADGTLTWDSGGGPWTPNGGGGGAAGGGGGGRAPGDGSDGGQVRSYAWTWLAALLLLAAKSLVCWCSEDPKAAATNIDLGFLTAMALLAAASLGASPLGALRMPLLQLTLAHICLEMGFYGVLLNAIDPSAAYRMSPEMWLHHAAVALGGVHTLAVCARIGSGVFIWVATQLIVTEITTFLPVAFHQAVKNRRMKGARSVVLGVLFPSAFVLRMVLSARVLLNYASAVRAVGGVAAVPLWWVSGTTSAVIVALNAFWTCKILAGGAKAMLKKRERLDREANLFSHASEAAVYSELAESKKRIPRGAQAATQRR